MKSIIFLLIAIVLSVNADWFIQIPDNRNDTAPIFLLEGNSNNCEEYAACIQKANVRMLYMF